VASNGLKRRKLEVAEALVLQRKKELILRSDAELLDDVIDEATSRGPLDDAALAATAASVAEVDAKAADVDTVAVEIAREEDAKKAAAAVKDVARAARAALTDGLLGAFAGVANDVGFGSIANKVSNKREKWLRQVEEEQCEVEREGRIERLSYFEPELDLLGLKLSESELLDERMLKLAFRERSRELHPDARGEGLADENEGIYELNQAYEVLRKLLC